MDVPSRLPWGSSGSQTARRLAGPQAAIRSQTSTEASLSSSTIDAGHLEGKLKIIGVGNRGSSVVGRLIQQSRISGAELWCLDSDRNVLDASGAPNTILIPKETVVAGSGGLAEPGATTVLPAEDMERIVGEGAADKHGHGNVNVGDGGVAFVLTSGGTIPGGSDTVVQLVRSLRAAGHFTAVAVTRPFEFEGSRKVDAADRLISLLEEAAHLVVVIEQDVLSKVTGGAAMTVAEATMIADNALEHTVRSILAALQAPEILKSTAGALIWHGRDLRRYRRLLSPPIQRLLTCPGTAALGRGVASMPAAYVNQMGASQALMHLASDAVRAAAESPFLEDSIQQASAVLCCISLPSSKQSFTGADGEVIVMHSLRDYDAEKAGSRMAVQAAAGALRLATGQSCQDIVLCAVSRDVPGPQHAQRPQQRLPPSNWNAMSALAGGTARRAPLPKLPPLRPDEQARPAPPSHAPAMRQSPFSGPSRPPASPSDPTHRPRDDLPGPAWNSRDEAESSLASWDEAPLPDAVVSPELSMGDYLVDSLTAQSLDLPPQAAKWRQQQRTADTVRPQLVVQEAAEWDSDEDEEPDAQAAGLAKSLRGLLGGPRAKEVDVKERTSGILQNDRSELWDLE
ncbi:hypothetical protein WJX72_004870 [[Myrmecia] bisecta]|uniref:Tubulin/FtsZ GTPase domain-containing protein n=1 Tax=[Myrmecia] bisecta TaxID=41462 RepID=A0AAW1PKG8_9CHLO